jgi:hypothetical protein
MTCGHLIVVAGLPCSGKSHLLSAIEAGSAAHVAAALGIDTSAPLHIAHARDSAADDLAGRSQVLLHFDLFAQRKGVDTLLQQLSRQAERVSFLTVVVPAADLRERHGIRLSAFMRSLALPATWKTGRVWFRLRRHRALRRLYGREAAVRTYYADWIAGCEAFSADHWVVDCTDEQFRCVRADAS